MDRDKTRKAAEVMAAYADGAEVEFCIRSDRSTGWHRYDSGHPSWDWEHLEYRIKPEPREFWVHVDGDAFNGTVNSHDPRCDGCIRVREVIEE